MCLWPHTPTCNHCCTATVKLSYKPAPYGTVFSPYSTDSMDPACTRGILCICPGPAAGRGGGGLLCDYFHCWLIEQTFITVANHDTSEIFISDLTKRWKMNDSLFSCSSRSSKDHFMKFAWEFHFMCAQSIMVLCGNRGVCDHWGSKNGNTVRNLLTTLRQNNLDSQTSNMNPRGSESVSNWRSLLSNKRDVLQ